VESCQEWRLYSDAHEGVVAAAREVFPTSSGPLRGERLVRGAAELRAVSIA
jgi:hypothetical protein